MYSIWGNQQAEFLIRIQAWKPFEAVNTWKIQISEKFHWNIDLAFCHLLQGWSEICHRHLSQAEQALAQAESILRPSGMVEEVYRLDWVWTLLAETKGEYQQGLQRVNDALRACADKGLRLRQVEHFVSRGRLYLQQYQKENLRNNDLLEKAADDGHEALKIAGQTGYVWAKVEALELLASYHQIRATLSSFNLQEEKDAARRYAEEAGSLKEGLFLTVEQMEELKKKAREEFERLIAE